ncbi:MAG: hypothetical protein Q9202_003190 [Teloschistes flavicans]
MSIKGGESLWFHAVLIETKDCIGAGSTSQNANNTRGDTVQEQTAATAGNEDPPSVENNGGNPRIDVYPHETSINVVTSAVPDVAYVTPVSDTQMENEVLSTDETEQEQGNLVGFRHGNIVNNQPVSTNESFSLFLESEETVHHQAHMQSEKNTNVNAMTEQSGTRQTSAAKSRPKQLRTVKHPATHPSKSQLVYQTGHYPVYDPTVDNRGPKVTSSFSAYGKYDGYALYMNPSLDASDAKQLAMIPHFGVRLDDLTVSKVLVSSLRRHQLHQFWQSEFDQNAMVRATRMPLGHAAKEFKKVGDTDIDGNMLAEGQQGWYYMWWTGLHLLCGKEGLDAGTYMVRPSFEKKRVPTFSWKIGHKAVIQKAPGQVEEPESRHDFNYESPDNWGNGGFCGC